LSNIHNLSNATQRNATITSYTIMSKKKNANLKVGCGLFDFGNLKLIELPDAPVNSMMKDTLEGCEGYLTALPLRAPNVDHKVPKSITDMVNILTDTTAEGMFAIEEENLDIREKRTRTEGRPSKIYDEATSPLMKRLVKKGSCCHGQAPGMLGHVVSPGCVSFYQKDGQTFAAPPGRWFLASYKAWWTEQNVSLDQDLIDLHAKKSQVLIMRVPPGAVDCVYDRGVPIILDVGTHVFNSGTVQHAGTIHWVSNDHINHGKYNYVRVPRGKFAKVWAEEAQEEDSVKALVPRLLAEGEHFIESHLFKWSGLCDVGDEYTHHGSIHRISVEKGCVAKVMHDNYPRLLGEGDHVIESSQFSYKGTESLISNSAIVHGTITILRVELGQIALAWENSVPVFIDKPGIYEWNSANFKFIEFRSAEDLLIQLGAKKIILVHTGRVAVTYDQGKLKVLTNGRHIIESATHVFHRFLSTQQRSIRLASLSAGEKLMRLSQVKEEGESAKRGSQRESHSTESNNTIFSAFSAQDLDADLTICETKDLVKVGLRADVFYSIEDPEKCINKIDPDELEDLVRETAVATLTNIIRSTALNEIAQSRHVSAGGGAGGSGGLAVLPPPIDDTSTSSMPVRAFFEKAHDEFLDKLHDDFMFRYGVDIANIRIESFKIMDTELSDQISKHALTTAQIENEMANLEGNSLISTTKERTAAEVKNISARAEAEYLHTATTAKNKRMIEAAEAAAMALKIQAKADAEAQADAILTKAKADAEAIRLKATAEAERAEMLSQTELGRQEALLGLYSKMVIESNKGVEKIIYLDPSVNRESPFAIGSLQNLNNDLHSLTHLGIAAGEGKR
jgi:regulator of protease activity HflC (stomatin/prohibitin superfamily)